MLIAAELIFLVIIMGLCAFYAISRFVWPIILAVILVSYGVYGGLPIWLLILCWILFLPVAGILYLPAALRYRYFTHNIAKKFQQMAPPISETERIALEAGDVWWEGEFFTGQPDWKKLHKLPAPQLTATEQTFLEQQVTTLCDLLHEWQITRENDLPAAVWNYIKEQGFWGLIIDREYGGHGFSAYAHSCIVTKIASRSVNAAVTIMVPNSLGPAELLQRYGTETQKNYYLPRLACGEEIPCFALTAPAAGSDAAHMVDNGIVCRGEFQGRSIIGIRLNWDKRYITLAPIATVIGLACKLYDPEHLLGNQPEIGITLCLIPAQHPGIEIGKRHAPMNLAFLNGPTRGKDVFIPLDWIIGGEKMRGQGWYMMMESLAVGRGISLPALATGMSQLCLRATGAYAHLRQQFKVPLGQFEGIQEALARMGGFTYLCEAARILISSALQQEIKPALASAITKYHLTELSRKIINDAMDIHGGKTIQFGPRNYLGSLYSAAPVGITVEGANILTRNLIIFGQGILRCHPFLRHELAAMQQINAPGGAQRFDRLLLKHVGHFTSQLMRLIVYSGSGGRLITTPAGSEKNTRYYYRQLTRMSAAFAVTVDTMLAVLGGELKRCERLSARLGDILSYLYLASAALWYYQQQPAEALWPFTRWSADWCLQQIQNAFDELWINFPRRRWVGSLLRCLVFPWGRAYKPPRDSLGQQIALAVQQPSALRDRLTGCCYIGQPTEILATLEHALQLAVLAVPIQKKLQRAIHDGQITYPIDEKKLTTVVSSDANILTADEVKLWQQLEQLRAEIISVDEFPPEMLQGK